LVLGCWQQAVELGLKEGFAAWPDFASNFVRFMSTGTVSCTRNLCLLHQWSSGDNQTIG
jgi:hypothetical protein